MWGHWRYAVLFFFLYFSYVTRFIVYTFYVLLYLSKYIVRSILRRAFPSWKIDTDKWYIWQCPWYTENLSWKKNQTARRNGLKCGKKYKGWNQHFLNFFLDEATKGTNSWKRYKKGFKKSVSNTNMGYILIKYTSFAIRIDC